MSRLRIEDYALIGDTHTGALVGCDGSIDWLCFPRFDAPACFAALVGTPENGRWLIRPVEEVTAVRRCYMGETMVLVTEMTTESGVVEVIDFMPRAEDFHRADLSRIVRGKEGRCRLHLDLRFRFDYGRTMPWVRHGEGGLQAVAGPDALHLSSPVPLCGDNRGTECEFEVGAGEEFPFVLTWFPSHEAAPEPVDAREMLDLTRAWWERWAARCAERGKWRGPVMRSLLTLKALTYSPTGGIVAAPTTSLPEWIGGHRNWDYRFCWLRDAGLTLTAFLRSGYRDEALAWRDWLLRAVAGEPSQLKPLYGLAGERPADERHLPWLNGYGDSRPVRVGNNAAHQLQLDIYGQVLDVFRLVHQQGVEPIADAWEMQKCLLEDLESKWRLEDEGLWEVRGDRRHFVHSKVMCWVAFDRALKVAEKADFDAPLKQWRAIRDGIHEDVCRNGFSSRLNSFVQAYDSEDVDAALLMIPIFGFLPPSDPRVVGTVDAIMRDLQTDGLVYRYHWSPGLDGLSHGEGAFLACSFWLVEALCMLDRREEAVDLFERLLELANDVGLYGEEYDPKSGRHLGNFPQAFSHIGLVSAANRLEERTGPGPTA